MQNFYIKLLSSYNKRETFFKKLFFSSISAVVSSTMLFSCIAFADILGTHISTDQKKVAAGTTLITNVYNDPNVGRQTEHYFEYTPNINSLPILTNGWSIYGKRNLSQANDILIQQGYDPAIGMNADFFSFTTGVPMSNTIIDGKVYTADTAESPTVGFFEDGKAYIDMLSISTQITTSSGDSFTVDCINKYRQPYAIYLYDSNYGTETHSPDSGRDIVLANVKGELKLGGSVTATVESISDNEGSVAIPEDKLVLGVSADASQEIKDRLNCLSEGTKIKISIKANSDTDVWNNIKYAVGGTGGKLLTDGKLDLKDESAAPRSAIGIRPDGSIIFYTIDGRQSGYSFGARKETVAKRLLELGCTDAVNLDGGGSTSMGYAEPGSKDFKIANSPSEGALRGCANFLFILNLAEADGIAQTLELSNHGAVLLSGASVNTSAVAAFDKAFRYADIPSDITYKIEDDADTPDGSGQTSHIDNDGTLTAHGNGDIYVGAKSDNAYGSARITSVATPQNIKIYDSSAGNQLDKIVIEPDTELKLDAVSTWYGETLISNSSCYRWTVISDSTPVGQISSNGLFTAASSSGATGRLIVHAGLCVTEIPILVAGEDYHNGSVEYPQITGSINSSTLTANVTGVESKKEVTVTIDGNKTDFTFDTTGGRLTCNIPKDSGYHKIGIYATNKNNASAMKFFDSSNIKILKNTFSDTTDHWANGYISYLADCGIINGSLEGDTILFRPNSQMTRAEFAIMLCNYLGVDSKEYADVELPFIDNDEIAWWAENHIKAIYKLGVMQGQLGQYGVSFNPNAKVNRMEFAIALNRLLPKGLKADPIVAADKGDIPFWAEDSMRVICTQGIMTGYPDGTLRPIQSVTRAEAVKMVFNILGAGK